MRRSVAGLVLGVLCLLPYAAGAQPVIDGKAAAATVLGQLDAFRRGDYDTAYGFASEAIHRLFDRQGFETMVRDGYPEIASSVRAHVASTRVTPEGHVYLGVRIRGANGRQIEAVYELLLEAGAWKINGVVARPDPGEDARASSADA